MRLQIILLSPLVGMGTVASTYIDSWCDKTECVICGVEHIVKCNALHNGRANIINPSEIIKDVMDIKGELVQLCNRYLEVHYEKIGIPKKCNTEPLI